MSKLAGRPTPWVSFTLDQAASRVLAQDRVPGTVIRRGHTGTVDGPVPLADHPQTGDGLRWWIDQLDERDRRRLAPVGVPPLRQTLARQPTLLDPAALRGLVRTLRSQDLAVGVLTEPDGVARVVGLAANVLVIGQAVPGSQSAAPTEVLRALGTLAWAGWSLAEGAPKLGLDVHVFLACRAAPSVDLVRFLEDQDHLVLWVNGPHVEFGPRTRLRWNSGLRGADPLFARHG